MPGPDAPQTPPHPDLAATQERELADAAARTGQTVEQVRAAREALSAAVASATLEDARDELERQLHLALADLGADAPPEPPAEQADAEERGKALHAVIHYAGALTPVGAVRDLAAALRDVQITLDARAATATAQRSPAPFDLDGVAAAVWNATQEAGAPSAAGDAAVATLRQLVEGPGPT